MYLKLSSLLREVGMAGSFGDTEITRVTDKAENVVPGSLFVAVKGGNTDGHELVGAALARGAAAAVTQQDTGSGREIPAGDTRKLYGSLCAAFAGHPDRTLRVIGITGTNGKTTTAEYLRHILETAGHKCGVIGTFGTRIDTAVIPNGYTTPSPDVLFAGLADMAREGCEYCVMEVSSQALAQARADAVRFRLGVLTNIGSDHLDYHGGMENYVKAKSRLFRLSDSALLNADDAYCEEIAENAGLRSFSTYSVRGGCADIMAKNIRLKENGTDFTLIAGRQSAGTSIPSICRFSVSNALAAASAAIKEGFDPEKTAEALRTLPRVRGRMDRFSSGGISVWVDFAHTPEALTAVLSSLSAVNRGRMITVFGCGGGRDKKKRPAMGAAAAAYSDVVILTEDNSRHEDVRDIIRDIRSGIDKKTDVFVCPDREKAIGLAIGKAVPGDTVLVAGKGHENTIVSNGEKRFFSDEETVKKYLCLR